MSQSILHNVPSGTLRPGPRLQIVVSPDGMTTASMDFTCRKYDIESPLVQAKLAKGTPIETLYPQIGERFSYLRVESYQNQDEPGAYSTITVNFTGVSVAEGEYTYEGGITYTRNNALRDESILNHPKVLSDLPAQTIETIRLGIAGTVSKSINSTESTYDIRYISNDQERETLTDAKHRWWWDFIVGRENHTFLKATSEWTKSATAKGGLRASDFAKFGKIDTPPGSPAALPGEKWIMSGAAENISQGSDGANSYSKTWTSGNWSEVVYGDSEAGS